MTVKEISNIIFKGNEKRLVILNNPFFLVSYINVYNDIEILYLKNYKQYKFQDGDVVFADIPFYNEKRLNKIDFDFDDFFKWARTQKYLVYFVNGKLPVPSFPTAWAKGRMPNGEYEETLYANRAI